MENFHNNNLNIPIVDKLYQLYRITHQWLKQFPKQERYALGEKLQSAVLETITQVYYLNSLPNALKENHLLILSAKNETAKILFRLTLDIGILDFGKYESAQTILNETGKMIGGWIKFLRNSTR